MANDVTLTPDQIALIKSTVAKGCSDNELRLFLHACEKTGLDPLMKQIYAVKRGSAMAIQTGIDGFRLIADRTGRYAPGQEPTYAYELDSGMPDGSPKLKSATAYIKKQTPDGTWHTVAATAYYDEYCPGGQFWQKMPHVMLAKVAEALALRRAFPADLSGLYSTEEMTQADLEQEGREKFKKLTPTQAVPVPVPEYLAEETTAPPISAGKHRALEAAITEYAAAYGLDAAEERAKLKEKMGRELGVEHFPDLDLTQYEQIMQWINQAYLARRKKA